ncbi:Sulfate starvation-induced protein 7 [Weissella viridescens]|uniref:Sulfate starvation-induced protein 7 n=1 Tax=Weissella viridescens TaxID=1629 RepID=A0A380P825_WEIVI|nr:Sulfate starvation-induced protein 7 [Weissella viridescens]
MNRKVSQYDTYDKAINDLQVGRVDAVLIDRDYANYYMTHEQLKTPLRMVQTAFPKDEYGVGFRKEDKVLRERVNRQLTELQQDGTESKLGQNTLVQPIKKTHIIDVRFLIDFLFKNTKRLTKEIREFS